MSWFQTSFSAATSGLASTLNNISGQLTDLTQDVLQEGVQSSFLVEEDDPGELSNQSPDLDSEDQLETVPLTADDVDQVVESRDASLFQPAVLSLDDAPKEKERNISDLAMFQVGSMN